MSSKWRPIARWWRHGADKKQEEEEGEASLLLSTLTMFRPDKTNTLICLLSVHYHFGLGHCSAGTMANSPHRRHKQHSKPIYWHNKILSATRDIPHAMALDESIYNIIWHHNWTQSCLHILSVVYGRVAGLLDVWQRATWVDVAIFFMLTKQLFQCWNRSDGEQVNKKVEGRVESCPE